MSTFVICMQKSSKHTLFRLLGQNVINLVAKAKNIDMLKLIGKMVVRNVLVMALLAAILEIAQVSHFFIS